MVHPLQLVVLLAANNLPILQAAHQDAADYSISDAPIYTSPLFQGSRDREDLLLGGPRRNRQEPDSDRFVNLEQLCRGSRLGWPPCDLFNSLHNSQSLSAAGYSQYANMQGPWSYNAEDGKGRFMKTEQNTGQDKLNSRFKRDTEPVVLNELLLPWVAEDPLQVNLLPLQEVAERQEKRSPRFSPWGGKRSDFEIIPVNKRSVIVSNSDFKRGQPFSSWGGKRAFSSWGGKREKLLLDDEIKRAPKFSSWGGKRGSVIMDGEGVLTPTFSSWGGKRDGPTIDEGDKRGQRFSSWGGKRDGIATKEDKRGAKFSSWGGKRDSATEDEDEKRAMKFSSWGGKRDSATEDEDEKRAMKFSSWGGKRDGAILTEEGKRMMKFSSWGGKRDNSAIDEGKRAMKFSSWGGKRDGAVLTEEEKRALKGSRWGGERQSSVMDEIDTQFPVLLSLNRGKNHIAVAKEDNRTPKLLGWTMKEGETLQKEDKRAAKFSSWGGKRDPIYADLDDKESIVNEGWDKENSTDEDRVGKGPSSRSEGKSNQELTPLSILPELLHITEEKEGHENLRTREKRAKFSSWGGKRTSELFEPLGDPEEVPEDSFVQKRDVEFRTWKGKRGVPLEGTGGKRAMRVGRFRTRQINSPPLRQNRRGADFYPWGGKRSDLLFFD